MHIVGIFHSGSLAAKEQRVPDRKGLSSSGDSSRLCAIFSSWVRSVSRTGFDQEELYANSDASEAFLAVLNRSSVLQTLEYQKYINSKGFESGRESLHRRLKEEMIIIDCFTLLFTNDFFIVNPIYEGFLL